MSINKIYKLTKKLTVSAFLCFLWSLFLQSCGGFHDYKETPVIGSFAQDQEKEEKDLQSDLEAEIVKWPGGAEILNQLKIHSDTIDLSKDFQSLDIEQCCKLFQHDRFKQVTLKLSSIGNEGAAKLALLLSKIQIRSLDLSYSNIGDEGLSKLVMVFPDIQMDTFNLSHNEIGDEGADELARVLPNIRMRILDLRYTFHE